LGTDDHPPKTVTARGSSLTLAQQVNATEANRRDRLARTSRRLASARPAAHVRPPELLARIAGTLR
jgi:hypothetical protein